MSPWYEIRCTVPAEEADPLAESLTGLTGNGVCTANMEVDTFDPSAISLPPLTTVTAYVESDQFPRELVEETTPLLEQISARSGIRIPPPEVREVMEDDWANRWKEWFKPLRIGKRTVVRPTWEPFDPSPGEVVIDIDPGQAFGTGTHETTRLCIELLEEMVPKIPACSVLDVGCGSGILAIAAVCHGALSAVGIDVDPQAVATAAENAILNGVSDRTSFHTTPLERIEREYPLVVANILAEDLVRMRHDLQRVTAPSGLLVLSGILIERETFVREGFADTRFGYVSTRTMGEWCALLFRRG